MLLGQVQRNMDDKGRFVLPEQFRDGLHGPLYFALGEQSQVTIWPQEHFTVKLTEKKELERTGGAEGQREFHRFTSFASTVKMDAQFRIPIPEMLRQKAGLDRNLTVTGNFDRIEVWDSARLDEYLR